MGKDQLKFMASLEGSGCVKFDGEGSGHVRFAFPATEAANVVRLLTMQEQVLEVTVKLA